MQIMQQPFQACGLNMFQPRFFILIWEDLLPVTFTWEVQQSSSRGNRADHDLILSSSRDSRGPIPQVNVPRLARRRPYVIAKGRACGKLLTHIIYHNTLRS